MKKTIIILTLFFAALLANAQDCRYSDYHFVLTIETTDGKITAGYMILPLCNLPYFREDTSFVWDFENYFESLKKLLNQTPHWWKKVERAEEIIGNFAQDRILYEYYKYANFDFVPAYFNWKYIPFDSIETITIEELQCVYSYMKIASELHLQDTIWVKKEPIKKVEFEIDEIGVICSYSIFIHENSPKIDAIISKLELHRKEMENIYTELKDFFNRPNKDEKDWEIKEKLYDLRDEKSKEMWETISQLNGKKVVVITSCSD